MWGGRVPMSPMFCEPVYVNQTEEKMPTNRGSFLEFLKLDSGLCD